MSKEKEERVAELKAQIAARMSVEIVDVSSELEELNERLKN